MEDLSLPMRNWNNFFQSAFTKVSKWFEPTYEELKRGENKMNQLQQIKDLSLPMRNWNLTKPRWPKLKPSWFEPTYEELKLQSGFSDFDFEKWFEPTYEELKRYRILRIWN